ELEWIDSVSSAEDGSFRIVSIPGPVLLMGGVDQEWTPDGQLVRSFRNQPPRPDARYPDYFPADHPGHYATAGGGFALMQGNFCKVFRLDPGTPTVRQDIPIEPASTITVKIQDDAGRPLAGAFVGEEGRAFNLDGPMRAEADSWGVHGVAESG